MHDEKYSEERLTELQEALKAHPAEERDTVYEETVADSGFNPFADDDDPHALVTQLKGDETDSYTNRLINYLLALISLFMSPYLYRALEMGGIVETPAFLVSMVLTVVIALLFAFIGRKRRSYPLSAYWLAIGLAEMPYMLGGPDLNQVGVVAVCLFMLTWLGRLIYKNRRDKLFVAFAMLPLVSWLVWTPGERIIFDYVSPSGMVAVYTMQISFVVTGIALALFFIGRQRGTKWMGVFAMFFIAMLSQLMYVFGGFSSFTLPALLALAAMALITMGVPAFFFWRDRRRPKEKQPDEFTAEPAIS